MMIDKLIETAKKEEWKKLDKELPEVCNNPEVIRWAYSQGLQDENRQVRDLAASILEKTRILGRKEIKKLYVRMEEDPYCYVRFRSAFALAAHNAGDYKPQVVAVLKEAEKNSEVADFAKHYLRILNEN